MLLEAADCFGCSAWNRGELTHGSIRHSINAERMVGKTPKQWFITRKFLAQLRYIGLRFNL
jgi:hypothetical protein